MAMPFFSTYGCLAAYFVVIFGTGGAIADHNKIKPP
jgi:hypothetical protein